MVPSLYRELKSGYGSSNFAKDFSAGVLVGVVSIPMNIAFAIGSGVSPEFGLLAGVVSAFVLTFLGGSSTQISGPTGAFMGMIYGIISVYGIDGLIASTFLAGFFLLILGLLRLGRLFQFIPFSVVIGFTAGIAVLIFTSQVNDLLGLGVEKLPKEFAEKWMVYAEHIFNINPFALLISGLTILGIVLLNRIDRRIPAALIMISIATFLNMTLGLSLATIGSRFGEIKLQFTGLHFPPFNWGLLSNLFLPAISIALLGGIESLLSAIVADRMSNKEHDSNMELVGQGIANILSASLGSIPVTGAIARTATNIKAGGQTPVSNFVHGIVLLLTLLFLSPYVGIIPMASLAGVLTTVAYNMSEQETFRELLKGPRGDVIALLATFVLTLVLDLVVAIPVGILASLLVFVKKMSENYRFQIYRNEFQDVPSEVDPLGQTKVKIPHQAVVVEFDGPLFFGTVESYKKKLKILEGESHKVILLRMRDVPSIDASGLRLLEEFVRHEKDHDRHVLLCALRPTIHRAVIKVGLENLVGPDNILPNVILGLSRAEKLLGAISSDLATRLKNSGPAVTLKALTKEDAIVAAFDYLDIPAEEKQKLVQACLLREKVGSTLLPGGLMVPHPRDKHLDPDYQEIAKVYYLDPPIVDDAENIDVMVLILSHTDENHLKVLAELVKYYRHGELKELFEQRRPVEDMLKLLGC